MSVNAELIAIRLQVQELQRVRAELSSVTSMLNQFQRHSNSVATSVVSRNQAAARSYDQMAVAANRSMSSQIAAIGRLENRMATLVTKAAGFYLAFTGGQKMLGGTLDQYEKDIGFKRTLKFNLGPAVGGVAQKETDAFIRKQGIDFAATRASVAKLAGVGDDKVKPSDLVPLLRSFTALAAASGATQVQQSRGFEQFMQIASQGKLQGDELRALAENMIQMRRLINDAGLGPRIGSKSDPIQWEEIKQILLKFGRRADVEELLKQQAELPSHAIERMQTAFIENLVLPLGKELAPAVVTLSEKFKDWAPAIGRMTMTLVDNAPTIIGLFAAYKLHGEILRYRVAGAALRSADALERLTVAASGAAVGMGGGYGRGPGGIGGPGGPAGPSGVGFAWQRADAIHGIPTAAAPATTVPSRAGRMTSAIGNVVGGPVGSVVAGVGGSIIGGQLGSRFGWPGEVAGSLIGAGLGQWGAGKAGGWLRGLGARTAARGAGGIPPNITGFRLPGMHYIIPSVGQNPSVGIGTRLAAAGGRAAGGLATGAVSGPAIMGGLAGIAAGSFYTLAGHFTGGGRDINYPWGRVSGTSAFGSTDDSALTRSVLGQFAARLEGRNALQDAETAENARFASGGGGFTRQGYTAEAPNVRQNLLRQKAIRGIKGATHQERFRKFMQQVALKAKTADGYKKMVGRYGEATVQRALWASNPANPANQDLYATNNPYKIMNADRAVTRSDVQNRVNMENAVAMRDAY